MKTSRYTTIECQFRSSYKNYTYLSPRHVRKGDDVVVETPDGHLEVVKVVRVDKEPNVTMPLKWIVQRVDRSDYDKRKKISFEAVPALVDAILHGDIMPRLMREISRPKLRLKMPKGRKSR